MLSNDTKTFFNVFIDHLFFFDEWPYSGLPSFCFSIFWDFNNHNHYS